MPTQIRGSYTTRAGDRQEFVAGPGPLGMWETYAQRQGLDLEHSGITFITYLAWVCDHMEHYLADPENVRAWPPATPFEVWAFELADVQLLEEEIVPPTQTEALRPARSGARIPQTWPRCWSSCANRTGPASGALPLDIHGGRICGALPGHPPHRRQRAAHRAQWQDEGRRHPLCE